jgi:hypothetical protein
MRPTPFGSMNLKRQGQLRSSRSKARHTIVHVIKLAPGSPGLGPRASRDIVSDHPARSSSLARVPRPRLTGIVCYLYGLTTGCTSSHDRPNSAQDCSAGSSSLSQAPLAVALNRTTCSGQTLYRRRSVCAISELYPAKAKVRHCIRH